MSPGLLVLVALAGLAAAGAVAMFVTAIKCECGARTPDLAGHYDYHHPTEECPR